MFKIEKELKTLLEAIEKAGKNGLTFLEAIKTGIAPINFTYGREAKMFIVKNFKGKRCHLAPAGKVFLENGLLPQPS